MAEDWYEKGMAMRRKTLGDAHVDRSTENATDFDREFQRYITEAAWGQIWSRPGLPPKTRSMLTVAILVALGREMELNIHLRGAINNGVSIEEIKEIFMHAAVYAGAPAALSAFQQAKKLFKELELI